MYGLLCLHAWCANAHLAARQGCFACGPLDTDGELLDIRSLSIALVRCLINAVAARASTATAMGCEHMPEKPALIVDYRRLTRV